MASVPINLTAYKPTAGDDLDAAKIANAMTAVESYTGSGLDMNALTQKGATIGQVAVWDGTKWTPGDGRYPMAPTILPPALPPTTTSVLTANAAHLTPFQLLAPTPITRLAFHVVSGGGTGNVDVGVYYTDDDATFTKVVSSGSTATPANGARSITVAQTTLTPVSGRRWYFAFACSSGTPGFGCGALFSAFQLTTTFWKTSSFALPSTLTGMTSPSPENLPSIYGLV